jgi:mRNA interferase RelE/StbE
VRWRIGDSRIIARIEDQRITILVLRVAHRREVYR